MDLKNKVKIKSDLIKTKFDTYFRREKPAALYLNSLLRTMALSLTGIFIPLYVLDLTGSIFWVLGYQLVVWGVDLLWLLPCSSLVYRLHFRWSVLLSNLLLITNFALLILARGNRLLLLPAALVGGLEIPLYWLPYHLIFTEDGAEGGFTEDVGVRGIIGRGASALGPFLGGLLITLTSFSSTYGLSAFLVLLSSLPLFFLPHHRDYGLPSKRRTVDGLKGGEDRGVLLSFFGKGVESRLVNPVWYLFAFGILGSYELFGGLTSGAMVLSFLALIFATRLATGGRREELLRGGILARGFWWLVQGLAWNPVSYFFFDLVGRLGSIFFEVPYDTWFYSTTFSHPHPFEFVLRRELAIHTGRIVSLVLLWGLFALGVPWTSVFALGALGMSLTLVGFEMSRRKNA